MGLRDAPNPLPGRVGKYEFGDFPALRARAGLGEGILAASRAGSEG